MPKRIDSPRVTTPPPRPTDLAPARPASVPVAKGDWTPQTGTNRPRPAATGPVAPLAPTSELKALSALDALKLVKNGDVDISLPVSAGELVPGKLRADANTTVKLSLRVRDGVIDYKNANVNFDPPLQGPLGVDVRGVNLTETGKARVDLKNLPDPVIGSGAPAKLSDLVDSLQNTKKIPVSVLGITVARVGVGGEKKAGTDAKPEAKGGVDPVHQSLADRIQGDQAKISVRNVSFENGALPLGGAGKIQLGADSKLSLEGSLNNLSLKGHANLQRLDLDMGGTRVNGGAGAADVNVQWSGQATAGTGTVKAQLSNFNLHADYAIGHRDNGDFIELAQGQISNGSLSVDQQIGGAGARGAKLDIGHFEGTISNGQITVPDGDGTATIKVNRSKLSGEVHVDDKHVMVKGDVELHAQIDGLQTPGAQRLDFASVKVDGKVKGDFDSDKGMRADGQVRVQAELNGVGSKVNTNGVAAQFNDGSIDASATSFELAKGGKLNLKGSAAVDLGVHDVNVGEKGISLSGAEGRVKGKADVAIEDGAVRLTNGTLKLSASVQDGKVRLGDAVNLDLKQGTQVDVALKSAFFGNGKTAIEFGPKAKLSAVLDGGSVALPGSPTPLKFKDGTKATFQFDQLSIPEKGIPEARGSISIDASLEAGQVDVGSLAKLPGVTISKVEGVEQHFKFDVGRFSIAKDGKFDVDDLKFGIEAKVKHFGGQIQ